MSALGELIEYSSLLVLLASEAAPMYTTGRLSVRTTESSFTSSARVC